MSMTIRVSPYIPFIFLIFVYYGSLVPFQYRPAMWDEAGVWGSYGFLDHPGFQTIGYNLNGLYFPELYK
jgi:hypothetical protein